ncbi:A disintegrin and metalloproteinase with thrombospondin motifs adt-2-like isoform X1 [Ruditapes philippinarum]|uniref:A disintegrin and metalloproteinase with thrombospondin motifs adt-2-like isoform X1 n=1 Tax=Ruditapes philippinarum TaxID=129788 RepID=UPI00295B3BA6|nr:A disintegrin and metalloproteinase with thrombospondin motifs adt-2-like isoform X1 [Ruditapes philippinarum]
MITYRSYYFALMVFIFSMGARHVDCLECYSCTNIFNKDNCTHTAKCGSGQLCYQDSSDIGQSPAYNLGCIDKHKCSTTNSGGGASQLVGRDLQKRQTESCHECCSTDNCNKHLCEHFKPATCIDDVKIDCGFLNTVTNICADIHHAKTICPKFCDLCSLVDGMWSDWTAWSTCDVTCDIGTQSRTRTCTNPPPSNGGLNCTGHARDIKSCHKQLCPVHGGWTLWGDWESCSVTCDTGLQKRHRNCTNPIPARYGDHCFDDAVDVQLCKPGRCYQTQSTVSVSFNARDVVTRHMGRNQRVIFKNIVFNVGGGYNKTTGVFTAPVDGTYQFSVHICKQSTSTLDVEIMVDGVSYATESLRISGDLCGSADTFAVLSPGKQVWVHTLYPGNNDFFEETNYFRNTFTGALV